MTQEDKELLLKDLCSRLPYGVKIQYHHIQETITDILLDINMFGRVNIYGHIKDICDVKPYLFPISSMTEEQKKEYGKVCVLDTEILSRHPMDGSPFPALYNSQDWLNKNHFDYRGLIKKGLANDATGKNIY